MSVLPTSTQNADGPLKIAAKVADAAHPRAPHKIIESGCRPLLITSQNTRQTAPIALIRMKCCASKRISEATGFVPRTDATRIEWMPLNQPITLPAKQHTRFRIIKRIVSFSGGCMLAKR